MTDDKKAQPQLWSRDFILIMTISLSAFLGFQMLMPTLPVYAKELGGSDAIAGLVIGIFALTALVARPLSGYALDHFGRKKLLMAGLVVFGGSAVAYHGAATLGLLLFIRSFHGFGWGISSTAASTTATDLIPRQRLGEGMGYYGLSGTLSMAVAPAAGLWIMQEWGFSTLFSVAAVMVVVGLVLAGWIHYPPVPLAGRRSFSLVEKTALMPATVMFFLTMTYGSIVSFLALYAQQQNIGNVGSFFFVYAAALLVTRPFAGRLSDRIGFDLLILPGIVCVMAAMAVIALSHTLLGLLAAAMLYGFGFGAVMPCLQALSVMNTPPDRRGGANGTFFTGFDLGLGLGSVIWGAVAQIIGYGAMFFWTLVPACIALALYLCARPTAGRNEL